MVLETKNTTLAYRCPHCGSGVMSAVGLFSLSADMVKLKCPCGKSELTAVYTNDRKVRLAVPCILCPKPHNFVVSEAVFFDRELFTIPCPYSDLNIVFMGEINHVKAELARTELELLDILEKNGISSFEALHKESEVFSDPQILEIVRFVVKDLEEEEQIHCHCPGGKGGEYDVRIMEDGILVFCKKCGASAIIPVDSSLTAQAFLDCDRLDLN